MSAASARRTASAALHAAVPDGQDHQTPSPCVGPGSRNSTPRTCRAGDEPAGPAAGRLPELRAVRGEP
ncbi:hypothetical protein ACH4PR_32965 [Streptomyces mirabilis]|uniref:hypothetical protein n=1 Tax=Streptomyces mirabilis TaxID=68239 RepID=UPI0037A8AC2A